MNHQRFTIRELAKESGVSIASIKYYVREGLLPPGDSQAEHRAHYDAQHLDRLRLIRALRDVGQLPIATIAGIFDAMNGGGRPFEVVAAALDAMSTSTADRRSRAFKRARADVCLLLESLGVEPRRESGAVLDLAAALVKLREMWSDLPVEQLRPYAESARHIARLESEANREIFAGDTATLLRTVVMGTVLFEPVLLALRRVMHEDFAKSTLSKGKRRAARRKGD